MGSDTESGSGSREPIPRDSLAEDARALVSAIESIHPTPYVGHGSKVELHRKLEETIRNLPETATVEDFYRRVAPLVAEMGDAHSQLLPPDRDEGDDDQRLPLSFRVVGEELYVESVYDESLCDLLGSRVVGIEGESVETLTDRAASLHAVENRYHALSYLYRQLQEYDSLDRLLGLSAPPGEVTVRFLIEGTERQVRLDPVPTNADPTHELEPTIEQPPEPGPRYRLYENGEAAVFVPGDLQGYRESFEVAVANDADFGEELAPEAHEKMVGGDQPEDLDELIAELPSMVETLCDLVREMAAAETRTLIVDLRDNPGGDSQFVNHVAYVLYGWDGVGRTWESVRSVKRRTEKHRERYGDWSSETGDAFGTVDENSADYDFSSYFRATDLDREELIDRCRDRLTSSDTFAAEVADGTHEAYYQPEQVIVVTNARTMSSGFAGAAQLSTLGADVVGVPSGQAPKSYGEPLKKTLPNTELTARIAGAMYHWIPEPNSDVLSVDRKLTPELFGRYQQADDASLLLAFDYAEITEPGECPMPHH